jgi:dienelactone hydrolase
MERAILSLPAGGRALLCALAALAGCGGGGDGGGVKVLDHVDPADFFSRPFPREDRRHADGSIDLDGFPRPSPLYGAYLDAVAQDRHGFGTSAAIFFRFSGPVDPASLPTSPAAALDPAASVFLVDLAAGNRVPVRIRLRPGSGPFSGPNLLAIEPFPGRPLRPSSRYAALVTTRVRGADGAPVGADAALAGELAGGLLAPVADWAAQSGLSPKEIAGATVFTTADPTADMAALREAVRRDLATPPAPQMVTWQAGANYDEYDGVYDGPIYQQGSPPYLLPAQGGTIAFDAQGRPQLVRTESIRFALTVPQGPMPAGGWPVVLYAHGTGGDRRSFIDDGTATRLAGVGVAVISIDQVLHGTRDPTGTDPEVTFFNFQNIAAARDNVRQGAADDFQLLRLVQAWPDVALPQTSAHLRFDPQRIGFMGHSQGGLTGPLFVAYEPAVRGAVFSGAGGGFLIGLLGKTQPVDIASFVATLLDDEPVDEFHPALALLQLYFEPADPANYGGLFFAEPPAGVAPRSIYQSIGLYDHYTPVPALEAFMRSMQLDPVGAQPEPIEGLDLSGITPIASAPVVGNVAGGVATGVAIEYTATGYDGHFVVFRDPVAQRQSIGFLQSLLAEGTGPATLPP